MMHKKKIDDCSKSDISRHMFEVQIAVMPNLCYEPTCIAILLLQV